MTDNIYSRDFKLEKRRLSVLLYGAPKVGKTRSILDLVKRGNYVCLMTTDHGTLEVYRNPTLYKGRLVVAEIYTLNDMRAALAEGKEIVKRLIRAEVNPRDIWACIDTITHLQVMLLAEARKVNLKNPQADADKDRDEYMRDMTMQVDWGINLGMMSEVANLLNSYPCNIVNIALEKEDRTTHRPSPSLSGQSKSRFEGDADIILRMAVDQQSGRKFQTSVLQGAGDRSGVLDEVEEPDLIAVRNKVFGEQAEQPTEKKDNADQVTQKN